MSIRPIRPLNVVALAVAMAVVIASAVSFADSVRLTGGGKVTNIRNPDDPARQPFQESFSLEIDPGQSATTDNNFSPNVPPNTRLAVDAVNVLGELPVGQKLIGVNVAAFVNNSASGRFVGTTFHGTSPSGVVFDGPFDIYAGDAGPGLFVDNGSNNVSLSAYRDGTAGTAHVFVQFFGHLVSLP